MKTILTYMETSIENGFIYRVDDMDKIFCLYSTNDKVSKPIVYEYNVNDSATNPMEIILIDDVSYGFSVIDYKCFNNDGNEYIIYIKYNNILETNELFIALRSDSSIYEYTKVIQVYIDIDSIELITNVVIHKSENGIMLALSIMNALTDKKSIVITSLPSNFNINSTVSLIKENVYNVEFKCTDIVRSNYNYYLVGVTDFNGKSIPKVYDTNNNVFKHIWSDNYDGSNIYSIFIKGYDHMLCTIDSYYDKKIVKLNIKNSEELFYG